jgi:Golgi nucleoside diphosphatase
VLIDAGSSGSRVHVYQYVTGASSNSYPAVQLPDEQFKVWRWDVRSHRAAFLSGMLSASVLASIKGYSGCCNNNNRIVQMTPGLSDYATALEGAAASVQALVDFALDKVRRNIPCAPTPPKQAVQVCSRVHAHCDEWAMLCRSLKQAGLPHPFTY